MAQELKEQFLPAISWTSNPRLLRQCEHMLVPLTSDMWTRGSASDAFAHELCEAMRRGVHRLIVHEVPGARYGDNEERHACSFDQLIGDLTGDIDGAPRYLLDAGLYNEIAMNVGGDEWRAAGLAKMAQQLAKGSGTREQWTCDPKDPARNETGKDVTVMVAMHEAMHDVPRPTTTAGSLLKQLRRPGRLSATPILREHRTPSTQDDGGLGDTINTSRISSRPGWMAHLHPYLNARVQTQPSDVRRPSAMNRARAAHSDVGRKSNAWRQSVWRPSTALSDIEDDEAAEVLDEASGEHAGRVVGLSTAAGRQPRDSDGSQLIEGQTMRSDAVGEPSASSIPKQSRRRSVAGDTMKHPDIMLSTQL